MSKFYTYYKIVCMSTGQTYVGCTSLPLETRIRQHRYNCAQHLKGNPRYNNCSSYVIIQEDNFKTYVLKEVRKDKTSKEEKKQLERRFVEEYLKKGKCVNHNIPNRTNKEYVQDKREYFNEYYKKCYHTKPTYKEYKRQYYRQMKADACRVRCELCNKEFWSFYEDHHNKTKKHQKKLAKLKNK